MRRLVVGLLGLLIVIISSIIVIAPDTYTITNLKVVLQNQDPDPVEPGNSVELRWLVENVGISKVPGLEFMIEPEHPFSLVPGQEKNKYVGTLNIKEEGKDHAILYYKLQVDRSANEGEHEIKIRYKTSDVEGWQRPLTFKIAVKTKNPILTVEKVATIPDRPKTGEISSLKITLANNGRNDLKDLFVSLNLDNTYFSSVGGTDERVIQRLDPDEKKEITYDILVSASADAKEYKVPLTIKYTDETGTEHTKENTITIVLDSTPNYLLNLEDTNIFTKNQKGKIVLSLSNTGSSNINYATISLLDTEYYNVISKSSEYLGNLESDDFETAEFIVYTQKVKKEMPLNVMFTYKDNYNKEYTDSVMIPLKIYSSGEAKKLGLVVSSTGYGSIILIIILAAGGYYYYRKRKKSAKKQVH